MIKKLFINQNTEVPQIGVSTFSFIDIEKVKQDKERP